MHILENHETISLMAKSIFVSYGDTSKNAIFQDENITRGDKIELHGAMPPMI